MIKPAARSVGCQPAVSSQSVAAEVSECRVGLVCSRHCTLLTQHSFRLLEVIMMTSDMVDVTISWTGQAGEVKLAGEFNNWTPEIIDKKDDGRWSKSMRLAPGKYSYKFVVDGDWKVNPDLPSAMDESGNTNNILEVEESDSSEEGSGGDSDSWEKVSLPEQQQPEQSKEDPMTSSTASAGNGNIQKISVVERVYSFPGKDLEKLVADNQGKLSSREHITTTFYDTTDCFLQRKAIWLEKLETSEGTTSWKLSTIDKTKLRVFDDVAEICEIVQEVLKDSSSLETIVSDRMEEISKKTITKSSWSLGETELELKCEDGVVARALIREVGDVVTALRNIESWAIKLKCSPYTTKMSGAA